MLCFVIFLEAVLQDMVVKNPTEKKTNLETPTTLKQAPARKLTEEKM